MLRIDVNSSRELQATILAIRQSKTEIRKNIRQNTKAEIAPAWTKSMTQNASTRLESRVLSSTATVAVSDQNIALRSATKGRKLKGGLDPKTQYAGAEYGANPNQRTTYRARSKKGKSFQVTRRTQVQFRPRNSSGYVFGPAVAEMVPRIAALWVQTTVWTFAQALEGKK